MNDRHSERAKRVEGPTLHSDDRHPERAKRVEGPILYSDDRHPERAERVEGPTPHPLSKLRQFTPARIALGRTGYSLPTADLLDFSLAHALARDAVHAPFDIETLRSGLQHKGLEVLEVQSAAQDRAVYLRRPDLGRQLDRPSREQLGPYRQAPAPQLLLVIADGLSAVAPERYALPVIDALIQRLENWRIGPVVLARQARVAIADEIGELLGAETTVVLIGERPGLSSPDSLGAYLTYAPRVGRSDAERNCVSNIRAEGLSPERAAETLYHLIIGSRRLGRSGVELKDESSAGNSALPATLPPA